MVLSIFFYLDWVVLYGISTIVGYLKPNSDITYVSNIYNLLTNFADEFSKRDLAHPFAHS